MASTMYINPNTKADPGTYGVNTGQSGHYIPGGAPSYIKSNADMTGTNPNTGKAYRSAYEYGQANNIAPRSITTTDTRYGSVNTSPYGPFSSQSGPSYYGGGYGGGGYGYEASNRDYSDWFNALTDIANAKYSALKQSIADYLQRAGDSIESNYAFGRRRLDKAFADKRNGQGLTAYKDLLVNRSHERENAERTAQESTLNAIAGRYSDLSGLTGQLPNMDENTYNKVKSYISSWSGKI